MKFISVIYIICQLVALLTSKSAYANNAAAGELSYTWLSGNTYRFVYKGYFDCEGSPAPASVYLCATNACANTNTHYILSTWTGSITYGRPNGSIVPVGCQQPKTVCESPSSALRGFREYWYTADITLSDTCSNWQFVTTINSRTGFDNVVPGNQYLRISFNNTGIRKNTSPNFSSPVVIYSSYNHVVELNNHLYDPDGDSLVMELIQPLTHSGTSNLCPTTPSTVALVPHTPPLSFPGTPFPTFTGFNIDTLNNVYVAATADGTYLVTYRVNEYRNGSLIGTHLRDGIFVIADVHSYNRTELDTAGLQGLQHFNPGTYLSCPGDTIRMCYRFTNTDTNARIYGFDTLNKVLPGVTVTYSGQGSDTVFACMQWVPSNADTGIFSLRFMARDSTCYPPGIADITWAYNRIYVRAQPSVSINKQWPNPAWPYLQIGFAASSTPCHNPWYQWQVNGKDVPGTQAQKYLWSSTKLNDGDHVRCLFKCYDTLCIDTTVVASNTVTIDMKTGVEETVINNKLALYPNPNNGIFSIIFTDHHTNAVVSLDIMNMYGQMVYETASYTHGKIDLAHLRPGIYILRLRSNGKQYKTSFAVH